jgi:MarR family transcriptional regulator, organic hydroperoxide resistance regulator
VVANTPVAPDPAPDANAVATQHDRLLEELRAYGTTFTEFSRRFADWLAMHSTDATALLEIAAAEDRDEPLSPARLSERISLSSGATTALLNRLETAGHIVRTRGHTDRRMVTLHTTEHVGELANQFFGPLAARLDSMMTQYPNELLEQFERFLIHLRATMNEHLTELEVP